MLPTHCRHPPPIYGNSGCAPPHGGTSVHISPPYWQQTDNDRRNDLKFISNISHATDVRAVLRGLARDPNIRIAYEWTSHHPPNFIELNHSTGVITYDPVKNSSNRGLPASSYKVTCSVSGRGAFTSLHKLLKVDVHIEVVQKARRPEPDDPPAGEDPSDPDNSGNGPDHPDSGNDGRHGGSNGPVTPPTTNANPACKIFSKYLTKLPSSSFNQINATADAAKTFIPRYPGVYEIHQKTLSDAITLSYKPITRANSVITARYKRSVYSVSSDVPDAFKLGVTTGTVSFIGNFDDQYALKKERNITVKGVHYYARSDGSNFTVFTTTPLTIKLVDPEVTPNKPIPSNEDDQAATSNVTDQFDHHRGLAWWIYVLISVAVLVIVVLAVYFIRRRK